MRSLQIRLCHRVKEPQDVRSLRIDSVVHVSLKDVVLLDIDELHVGFNITAVLHIIPHLQKSFEVINTLAVVSFTAFFDQHFIQRDNLIVTTRRVSQMLPENIRVNAPVVFSGFLFHFANCS
ncbi:hypothetical protein D3C87_1783610 [compost metagenome]